MSDAPQDDPQDSAGKPAESDWQRRRRLSAVFGDVLPQTTSDERSAKARGEDATDAWLRAQVPPHHG